MFVRTYACVHLLPLMKGKKRSQMLRFTYSPICLPQIMKIASTQNFKLDINTLHTNRRFSVSGKSPDYK